MAEDSLKGGKAKTKGSHSAVPAGETGRAGPEDASACGSVTQARVASPLSSRVTKSEDLLTTPFQSKG